ncbi:LPXTG cell wall anchor domain-containing protein [Streptomyces sp. BV286]|uniref:LPXTG cell wall anchor domain-containing protein n=1 Tax=unclassified Streptomyces TaxID=2593676 RepID=UPI001C2EFDC4|nr:LPXTG cell wall anchor domain-containing protein [Streptomyces sp. BV286]MBV1938476.1 LPXTG cell wall anchor domain-containing protein [Streptomyces sp. BV286]
MLRPRAAGTLAGITAVVLTAVVVGTPAAGAEDPPAAGGYERTARLTTVGKPLDLLLHPESGKLYVGSDTVAGTTGASLAGVYALDPAAGNVLSWVKTSPGSTGAPAQLPGKRLAGPLPGDGVHYLVGLRGVAAAKDGDTAGRGGWLTGTTITQARAGAKAGTVVVVRGTRLEEVAVGETAVTVERSLTLPATGGPLAVDSASGRIWVADNANSLLRGVDSAAFAPDGKDIPLGPGAAVSFLEWDVEHGKVWAGRGAVLEAYDIASGELAAAFRAEPGDSIADVAVDPRSDQAFAVWQDYGNPPEEGDGVGQLTVYDTATLKDAGKGAELPGNNGQLGSSSVAVTPGGGSVFVASPSDASLTVFTAPVPPTPSAPPSPSDPVSPSPSVPVSPGPSDGSPDPSPGDPGPDAGPTDSGTTVPVDGPTADGNGVGGAGDTSGGGAQSTTGGGSFTAAGGGSLASTGSDVILPAAAGTAALIASGTAAVLWRRRRATA